MTAKAVDLAEKEIRLENARQWRAKLIAVRDELQSMLDRIPRLRNIVQHRR